MFDVEHGLFVGTQRADDKAFVTFKAVGKLTHEDYQLVTPIIESALHGIEHPSVNALFDITEFDGWELRAAWDDLQLGLKHGRQFNKIALYGKSRWQEAVAKIGSWFIAGEIRYFDTKGDAVAWLVQTD